LNQLRQKLTYANVMATVAVFLVIGGGTAFAATQMLPKNSVGTKQLKNAAVTPAKLSSAAKAAMTGPAGPAGPKGATGAKGANGAAGAKGATGDRGPAGPTGPQGPAGATQVTVHVGPKSETGASEVTCPAGEVAVSGGGETGFTEESLVGSTPNVVAGTPTGWVAEAETFAKEPGTVTAYVVCAKP
jgi:hypothetical protein